MRVLVASDGNLPARRAAEFAIRLCGDDGTIRILTAVEVPRSVLASLRSAYEEVHPGAPVDTDAEYVSAGTTAARVGPGWPGDDTFIDRYVRDQTALRLEALRSAVEELGGETEVIGLESEDPTGTVLAQIDEFAADVLVIGSHARGRLDGMLGSVGNKLIRRAAVPVLVCRA